MVLGLSFWLGLGQVGLRKHEALSPASLQLAPLANFKDERKLALSGRCGVTFEVGQHAFLLAGPLKVSPCTKSSPKSHSQPLLPNPSTSSENVEGSSAISTSLLAADRPPAAVNSNRRMVGWGPRILPIVSIVVPFFG